MFKFAVSSWHTGYFGLILVNEQEYTENKPHLSFVIIDRETKLVVGSVDFYIGNEVKGLE